MSGMVSFYSPQEHVIIGGEITPFLRRLVEHDPQRKDKLFVVLYSQLGNFVIAEWLAGPKDIFVDVMNLGKSLGNFTHKKAEELRRRLFSPVTCDETSDFIAQNESDYLHSRQDGNEEETERWERVARGE